MKNRFLAFASLILLCALNTGCKEDTIIKANVTPSSDFILSNPIGDTLTIYTKTVYDDSISVRYNNSSYEIIKGLGTLNDPFFGRTNWSIFTQFIPTANNITIASPNTMDSAVLILPYANFSWGDTNNKTAPSRIESFSVYAVTEDMYKDSTYYTKTSFKYDATPIGEVLNADIYSLKTDSIKVAGSNRAPHLRIKLTNAFMQTLYNAANSTSDNATFLSQIKGFYIVARDTNNSTLRTIPYFYLTGSADYQRAAIALYYNDPTTNPTFNPDNIQTIFFNFSANDCAHNNYITHNYSSAPINSYLQSTNQSDDRVFLQNEPGAAIDIRIPYIKYLPKGVINKAQLVITQVDYAGNPRKATDIDTFSAPPRIYPVGVDASGGAYTIQDRYPTDNDGPLAFIDGNKNVAILADGTIITQYYINIPREVQKAILNQANELHLRINGTVTYPGAYRLMAGGKGNTYRVRLNISYTKIN